jgi:hypothetical protein
MQSLFIRCAILFAFFWILQFANVHSEFVATKEWQQISKDTPLPPGLHVRINMSTGAREAKLVDENEINEETKSSPQFSNDAESSKIDAGASVHYLMPPSGSKSRAKFTHGHSQEHSNGGNSNSADILSLDHPDRDIKRITKEDMRELIDRQLENDPVMIMTKQLKVLRNDSTTAEHALLLFEELEDACHDYDNANNFMDLGGLDVVLPLLQVRVRGAYSKNLCSEQENTAQTSAHKNSAVIQASHNDSTLEDSIITAKGSKILFPFFMRSLNHFAIPFNCSTTSTISNSTESVVLNVVGSASDSFKDKDDVFISVNQHDDDIKSLDVAAKLQVHALWIIGTMAQNNESIRSKVEAKPVIMSSLVHLIRAYSIPITHRLEGKDGKNIYQSTSSSSSSNSKPFTPITSQQLWRLKILNKALYSLNALLRGSEVLQRQFHEQGGMQLFERILQSEAKQLQKDTLFNTGAVDATGDGPVTNVLDIKEFQQLQMSSVRKVLSIILDIMNSFQDIKSVVSPELLQYFFNSKSIVVNTHTNAQSVSQSPERVQSTSNFQAHDTTVPVESASIADSSQSGLCDILAQVLTSFQDDDKVANHSLDILHEIFVRIPSVTINNWASTVPARSTCDESISSDHCNDHHHTGETGSTDSAVLPQNADDSVDIPMVNTVFSTDSKPSSSEVNNELSKIPTYRCKLPTLARHRLLSTLHSVKVKWLQQHDMLEQLQNIPKLDQLIQAVNHLL